MIKNIDKKSISIITYLLTDRVRSHHAVLSSAIWTLPPILDSYSDPCHLNQVFQVVFNASYNCY